MPEALREAWLAEPLLFGARFSPARGMTRGRLPCPESRPWLRMLVADAGRSVFADEVVAAGPGGA